VDKTPRGQVYSVIGSSAALRLAACDCSVYASAQGAAEVFTRYLAKGLGARCITVNGRRTR
jgi:NAD(P)-dependent dehydrogenase (short-subunit alcohol dehydrogenase family)